MQENSRGAVNVLEFMSYYKEGYAVDVFLSWVQNTEVIVGLLQIAGTNQKIVLKCSLSYKNTVLVLTVMMEKVIVGWTNKRCFERTYNINIFVFLETWL